MGGGVTFADLREGVGDVGLCLGVDGCACCERCWGFPLEQLMFCTFRHILLNHTLFVHDG